MLINWLETKGHEKKKKETTANWQVNNQGSESVGCTKTVESGDGGGGASRLMQHIKSIQAQQRHTAITTLQKSTTLVAGCGRDACLGVFWLSTDYLPDID